jgi:uncharacterized protein (UPF0218 family)
MGNDLKIPEDQRHKFSQPLGKLIAGTREETIAQVILFLKNAKERFTSINCYLVGDIVTQDFLNNQFLRSMVKMCIIDEKTKRASLEFETSSFFNKIIEMENPKSGINPDSFEIFKSLIETRKKALIKITQGEEDLLVLPLVITIPLNKSVQSYVFYGQPPVTDSKTPIPEGIVMVEVSKSIKKVVKRFLTLMNTNSKNNLDF